MLSNPGLPHRHPLHFCVFCLYKLKDESKSHHTSDLLLTEPCEISKKFVVPPSSIPRVSNFLFYFFFFIATHFQKRWESQEIDTSNLQKFLSP